MKAANRLLVEAHEVPRLQEVNINNVVGVLSAFDWKQQTSDELERSSNGYTSRGLVYAQPSGRERDRQVISMSENG